MSTVLTPGQGPADELPAGHADHAASGSIGRLAGAPGVWLFVVALAVASAAVFVAFIRPMAPYGDIQLPWPFFAVAFGLAEVGILRYSARSGDITVSFTAFPLVLGFYLADPSELVLAQLAGSAVALVLVRRQTPTMLAFNLALFSLSSSLAIAVFRAIAPLTFDTGVATWPAAFAAASMAVLVSALAIAVLMSISLRQTQPGALRAGLLLGLLAAIVNTSLALLAVEFLDRNPESFWLVLAPGFVAILTYRAFAAQREREARIEFLLDKARILLPTTRRVRSADRGVSADARQVPRRRRRDPARAGARATATHPDARRPRLRPGVRLPHRA